jgi:hypothetical protein
MASPKATKSPGTDEKRSFWEDECKIPSIKKDPLLWNKGWEKALPKLSAHRHVYPEMGKRYYKKEDWDRIKISTHRRELKDRVRKAQQMTVELWEFLLDKGDFMTVWFLLNEDERQPHLLKGLQETCLVVKFQKDARALCPEITITAMSKRKGRGFVEFLDAYRKGIKDLGQGQVKLYAVPSAWWDKALEGTSQSVSDTLDKAAFELLTLHRDHFIGRWLRHQIKKYALTDAHEQRRSSGYHFCLC